MKHCIIFKTIMVSLHRGRFVVVHLYSTFSVDAHNFPLGANLYQKLSLFSILGAVSSHFKSHNGEIWHEGADLGLPPQAKFGKNRLGGILGKIIPKNTNFCDNGDSKPTF